MGDATTTPVTVRLSARRLAKLDALAVTAGLTRSKVLQGLIDGSGASGGEAALAEPLTLDDLVAQMEERARNGSTAAIKWLAEHHRGTRELERLRALTTDSVGVA